MMSKECSLKSPCVLRIVVKRNSLRPEPFHKEAFLANADIISDFLTFD